MSKRQKGWRIALCVLLALGLIPMPIIYNDGGTRVYAAALYKIIVWHRINPEAYDAQTGEAIDGAPEFLTGTDVYFFPFHFGDKEYRSQ